MVQLTADITKGLFDQISTYQTEVKAVEIGHVTDIGDGIAHVSGLPGVRASELVQFSNGTLGIAFNLEESNVGVIIMGEFTTLKQDDEVRATGRIASVPVGMGIVGRVVSALGEPLDGRGPLAFSEYYNIERVAPGVIERKNVFQPVQTGIMAIDALIPIGRGQRELIIGDRQTGKTAIALDTIINQKGQNLYCIYVAIGQKEAQIAAVRATLEKYGAMDYTTIVVASAGDPAALQYIAPYAGCAMGEWFLENGKDALIIYDDLSRHAWAYRQVSLLLRRPPGREAYPGDVFYLHSRLLERAAQLSDERGGGSLTALPIIETLLGDVAAYIPTNVISITDGQIYLETDLFNSGLRPALNVGISVSRVGGDAQLKAMRQVAGRMKGDLAQFRSLAAFAMFGSDLDKATQKQLDDGAKLQELLKQPQYSPYPVDEQVMLIYAGTRGFLEKIPVAKVKDWQTKFSRFVQTQYPQIGQDIVKTAQLTPDSEALLKKALTEFNQTYNV
jgi:F-type H+-transporting ATPase subunit alpha